MLNPPLQPSTEFGTPSVIVMTLYNAVHFIKKLEALGLNVEEDARGRISAIIQDFPEGSQLRIEGFDHFLALIQTNLMREDSVVAIIKRGLDELKAGKDTGKMSPGSRVGFSLHHHMN